MKLDFISNKKVILYQSHSFSDISSLIYSLDAENILIKVIMLNHFYLNKRNRTLNSNNLITNYAVKII